mmetsp:Transcript_23659/g.49280  ORF Transcript_23659/g.49280 Transcript_23659/m.49280 type:complete len:580 (+) Transcript_23659:199-1938(+)
MDIFAEPLVLVGIVWYVLIFLLIFYAFNGRVVRYVKMHRNRKTKTGGKIHPSLMALEKMKHTFARRAVDKQLTIFDKNPVVETNCFINDAWAFPRSTHLMYCFLAPITIPIRLGALIPALVVGCSCAWAATLGLDVKKIIDGEAEPMAGWRRLFNIPITFCGRVLLFSVGVVWISVKGKPASSKDAPMIIANHRCFMDPIFIVSQTGACPVSASSNMRLPLFGNLIKMFQPILVDRNKKDNSLVANKIKERATSEGKWPQTVLFPEGTCTNGKALIYFKCGAFSPSVPVQPVLFKYPNAFTDISWVEAGPEVYEIVLKCLCAPWINMQVEYMKPYVPSEQEKKDTKLFARNVRKYMADGLGVQVTDQSFDDQILMTKAAALHLPKEEALLNLREVRKVMDLSVDDAKDLLEKFSKLGDVGKDGKLGEDHFVQMFQNHTSNESYLRKLFKLLDTEGHGYLHFREYVLGVTLLNCGTKEGIDSSLRLAFKILDDEDKGGFDCKGLEKILRMGYGDSLTVEQAETLFKEADVAGNGIVTCDEFIQFAHNHEGDIPKFRDALFKIGAPKEEITTEQKMEEGGG